MTEEVRLGYFTETIIFIICIAALFIFLQQKIYYFYIYYGIVKTKRCHCYTILPLNSTIENCLLIQVLSKYKCMAMIASVNKRLFYEILIILLNIIFGNVLEHSISEVL
jgi:hypothetical protein